MCMRARTHLCVVYDRAGTACAPVGQGDRTLDVLSCTIWKYLALSDFIPFCLDSFEENFSIFEDFTKKKNSESFLRSQEIPEDFKLCTAYHQRCTKMRYARKLLGDFRTFAPEESEECQMKSDETCRMSHGLK